MVMPVGAEGLTVKVFLADIPLNDSVAVTSTVPASETLNRFDEIDAIWVEEIDQFTTAVLRLPSPYTPTAANSMESPATKFVVLLVISIDCRLNRLASPVPPPPHPSKRATPRPQHRSFGNPGICRNPHLVADDAQICLGEPTHSGFPAKTTAFESSGESYKYQCQNVILQTSFL
jgi:hypothetical protein